VIEAPVYNRHGDRTGERIVLSPWWQVWKGANEAMLRFGGRFGLSPSDRAALKVTNGREQQSKGQDLLTG
jgi:phage terminase small subunit